MAMTAATDRLQTAACEDPTRALPEEIMAHILAACPKGTVEVAARVCHRWRATAIALADVGGARGPHDGRMGLRLDTIDHAAGGGYDALVDWLRKTEKSPWSQDTAAAALRGGHTTLFERILAEGGTDVLGTRLAAASVACGRVDVLSRLESMGCPVDGWVLMVGAAVLPLDAMKSLSQGRPGAPARFVAALLGRTDMLDVLCACTGTYDLTTSLYAVLDPDVATSVRQSAGIRTVYRTQDSDRLCDALAARSPARPSAHALVNILLDLQRQGYVVPALGPSGPMGPRGCVGVVGPRGAVGPRTGTIVGPRGAVGCAGPRGAVGPRGCTGV
ncbi:Collagen triple helix incomplete domain containing protein [Pandoravirus dulcis]|uniref:Collagen triple helix incomplete domain containing protein n=1 Tax=Pandoravirus dulcis TaxID=1349409 RepID=A0A291ATW9_9VIRU|nr:Collagen triple helix incomplete domain containing protein [Pandoravirus dulcis]ATE82472.1 Collagen triple helix incomplete domain containing protein [Pandoravirus dulcis]